MAGYSPRGHKESDTPERLYFHFTSVLAEAACNDLGNIFKVGLSSVWASLVAQMVKHLPAMQETQIQSLGQEDPFEEGVPAHSSILDWRIPWAEEPGRP